MMGQANVLAVLDKHPNKWLSVRDIAAIGHLGRQSATMSCRVLRRNGEVEYEEARTDNGIPYYIYRRKRD